MSQSSIPTFPNIDGLIARYSARGLTNEQMSENPILKDLTGNGHDIALHNFAWGGMSGIGGYYLNFSTSASDQSSKLDMEVHSDKVVFTNIDNIPGEDINLHGIKNLNAINDFTFRISGMKDGEECYMVYRAEGSSTNTNIIRILSDGEFSVDIPSSAVAIAFEIGKIKDKSNRRITIEQLPLYPNAIVSDGVDDYGICENFPILTKEEGFTVIAIREYLKENVGTLVSNQFDGVQDSSFSFECKTSDYFVYGSFGGFITVDTLADNKFSYMTSTDVNGQQINKGNVESVNDFLLIFKYGNNKNFYSNAALYDLLIYNRDLTEEEIGKIKTYFAKIHPDLSIN